MMKKINITITEEELFAIIAALNFTKNKCIGISWNIVDENILQKLLDRE
jgi:hypothetical protein